MNYQNNYINYQNYQPIVYPEYVNLQINSQKYVCFMADVSKNKNMPCVIDICGTVKEVNGNYIQLYGGERNKIYYSNIRSPILNYFTKEYMDMDYLKDLCEYNYY